MGSIILDCDLMRYPNSGLYHYCLNLGLEVNRLLEKRGLPKLTFYVPPKERNSFGANSNIVVEKAYHRFIKPFLWNCKVWHAPFQSGRIVPFLDKSIPVLLTIHDLNVLHEGKSIKEQKLSIDHTQQLINRSNAIVCISEFSKSNVLEHCEVKDKPVYVIHNGTNVPIIPKLSDQSYHPKRPFVFAIGYVNRKKNFHVLLSLLQQDGFELVIAGKLDDFDYIEEMKEQALQLGVRERLHILGPITEEDKAWYLKNCIAFSLPSLAEGFGLPVLEAMHFGKPIFLSNRTSLPEVGGDVVFYFKSFDSAHMQQVFKEGLKKYGENGLSERIKKRGEQFKWEEKAAEYVQIYQSLL